MRILLLSILLLVCAPFVASGETCTFAAGTSTWSAIGTVAGAGTTGCTESDDDLFVIPTGATVNITGDIAFNTTTDTTGIHITGGTLGIDVADNSGDAIIITLPEGHVNATAGTPPAVNAIDCDSGTITMAGGYRQWKTATTAATQTDRGDSADDDTYFQVGDVLMCPGDSGATGATAQTTIDLDFIDNDPARDTIDCADEACNFNTLNFEAGMRITIANAADSNNDGNYIIDEVTSDTVLTLRAGFDVTADDDAGTADIDDIEEWFSDCGGAASSSAGVTNEAGFHYAHSSWDDFDATTDGDLHVGVALADLVAAEDVLGFPYLGEGSSPEAPYMYQITTVNAATTVNDNHIFVDINQGARDDADAYPLSRRAIIKSNTVNARTKGDRCIQTTDTIVASAIIQERAAQWLYFDANNDGYADRPYRINIVRENTDCDGVTASGTDAIHIGDLRGFATDLPQESVFWIMPPGFETGDTMYVMAPVRLIGDDTSGAGAEETDSRVNTECAMTMNAVVIGGIGKFGFRDTAASPSLATTSRDVWIFDSGLAAQATVDIVDLGIDSIQFDHWTLTGSEATGTDHGFVFANTSSNVTLLDVATRYIGDDSVVASPPAGGFWTIKRLRGQFITEDSTSASTLDLGDTIGGISIEDVECAGNSDADRCFRNNEGITGGVVAGVTVWGSDQGIIESTQDVVYVDVIASGVINNTSPAGKMLPPDRVERAHLWDVHQQDGTNNFGVLNLHDSILQDATTDMTIFANPRLIDNVLFRNADTTNGSPARMFTMNNTTTTVIRNLSIIWDRGTTNAWPEIFGQVSAAQALVWSWGSLLVANHDRAAGASPVVGTGLSTAELADVTFLEEAFCFYNLDHSTADLDDRVYFATENDSWIGNTTTPGSMFWGNAAPFQNPSALNFTLMPQSEGGRKGCGINFGAAAPGLTRKRWGHYINRIEPHNLGQVNAGAGGAIHQGSAF